MMVRQDPDDDKIAYYRLSNGDFTRNTVAVYRPGKKFSKQEQWLIEELKAYRSITLSQHTDRPGYRTDGTGCNISEV